MLKRKTCTFAVLFSLLFTVAFSACSSDTEGEGADLLAENQELTAQNEALLLEQESLLAENEDLQSQLQASTSQESGEEPSVELYAGDGFVATVWGFVPEFENVPENQIAVILSEFQSDLFIAYIDEEMSEQLEIQGTYFFESPDIFVGYLPESQANALYENANVSATELSGDTLLYITGFREPGEDESGLSSPLLSYYFLEDDAA